MTDYEAEYTALATAHFDAYTAYQLAWRRRDATKAELEAAYQPVRDTLHALDDYENQEQEHHD